MRIASYHHRFAHLAVIMGALCTARVGFAQDGATQAGAKGFAYPECTNKPTESDTQAAKGAFQAGTAAYNEADYARAITYWEDAFRRDCTATGLLLNLARAYESSTQYERAIIALRTHNERNQDSPQKDQIQRRIERLEEQLKAEANKPAPVVAAPVQAPTKPPANNPPPPVPTDEAPSTKPSVVPLIIAISGGGIALLGGAGYLKARSDAQKYEEQCGGRDTGCMGNTELLDKGNNARDQQLAAGWLAGAGLAIGIGGAVWYFFEVKRANNAAKQAEASWHLMPEVAPGFAGLSLDGRF